MQYQWADGFRAPKGVDPDEVFRSLKALPEPSPEHLLDASKSEDHVLHEDLWSEGDQVWAQRARLDRCRHIIRSVVEVVVAGKREIEVRAVEFIRPQAGDKWALVEDIVQDDEMMTAYLAEVQRLQDQANAKMVRLLELRRAA